MAESFEILDQRQAGTTATTHYTVPAATQTIVRHVTCLNTHASSTSTIKLFVGGTTNTNVWLPAISLAPNERVVFDGALALDTGKTIVAIASVAAAVTVTISGAEIS